MDANALIDMVDDLSCNLALLDLSSTCISVCTSLVPYNSLFFLPIKMKNHELSHAILFNDHKPMNHIKWVI